MSQMTQDVDTAVALNAAVHRCVTELSGNKVLLDFATQVDRRVRWYYTPVARQRGNSSQQMAAYGRAPSRDRRTASRSNDAITASIMASTSSKPAGSP